MQQTFEINAGQTMTQKLIAELAKFGTRQVRVTIEDIEPEKTPSVNQKELYKKTIELRKLFKDAVVPSGVNLSDLANEMLGE